MKTLCQSKIQDLRIQPAVLRASVTKGNARTQELASTSDLVLVHHEAGSTRAGQMLEE